MALKPVPIPSSEIQDFLTAAVSVGFIAEEFSFSSTHDDAVTATPFKSLVTVTRNFAGAATAREYEQGQSHDWVNEALADLKQSLFGEP